MYLTEKFLHWQWRWQVGALHRVIHIHSFWNEDFHFCLCIVLVNVAGLMVQQETCLWIFWKNTGFHLYWEEYAINKVKHNGRNLREISHMAILRICLWTALQRGWTVWTWGVNQCSCSYLPSGRSRKKQLLPGAPFSYNTQIHFENLFLPFDTKYGCFRPISPLSSVISAHRNSAYLKPASQTMFLGTAEN